MTFAPFYEDGCGLKNATPSSTIIAELCSSSVSYINEE